MLLLLLLLLLQFQILDLHRGELGTWKSLFSALKVLGAVFSFPHGCIRGSGGGLHVKFGPGGAGGGVRTTLWGSNRIINRHHRHHHHHHPRPRPRPHPHPHPHPHPPHPPERRILVKINCNDILCHGTVPRSWCCTLFNMLPKKVRPTQATDFRPIANIRLFYKVFACLVLERIELQLDDHQPEETVFVVANALKNTS